MRDWNVVASVRDRNFTRARHLLEQFGPVATTDFYNVLVARVDDVAAFLDRFAKLVETVPEVLDWIARLVPCAETFTFQTPEAFEERARDVVLRWTSRLASKSFHVRLHRRGFKGALKSQEEERFLDEALLAALEQAGTPGRIDFENPDAVIDVETVGNRAGLSFWTRDELERYPFLRPG